MAKTKTKRSVPPAQRAISAPKLPYQPRDPKKYHPAIGLIACGGITRAHLNAYQHAGYNVVALCDLILERAENRRKEFFPKAAVYTDYRQLLKRDDIEVVDIATHPPDRWPIIQDALEAGKHVLSQKPFVLDLDLGERLIALAQKKRVKLAVNQNGRWSPGWAYMREAIRAGLVGRVNAAHLAVHWDHNWVTGTPFDKVFHVILYDFAIHWFDILCCFMGDNQARRVYASCTKSPRQRAQGPMLAQAAIEFDHAQASLTFDADTKLGSADLAFVTGDQGTLFNRSFDGKSELVLYTPKGIAKPELVGKWFDDGFHGTMGELLCAIEEKREPYNSARNNLKSLALCFAGCASADLGQPVVPGTVRQLLRK